MKKTRLLSLLLTLSILAGSAAPVYAADSGGADDAVEAVSVEAEAEETEAEETEAEETEAEETEAVETEVEETEAVETEVEETEAEETEAESIIAFDTLVAYHINPLYADEIDTDELGFSYLQSVSASGNVASASVDTYHEDIQTVGVLVREAMKARSESVMVGIKCAEFDEKIFSALLDEIMDTALEHTGVPDEGDYIKWQYGGASFSASYGTDGEDYYIKLTVTFKYRPKNEDGTLQDRWVNYYTTAAMEAEMNERIPELLDSLELDKLGDFDDYKIIKKIYDYVCRNVVYDYENLEDNSYMLKYTAYAALVNKTSVCQGYSVLMYRLLLTMGIDNRVIYGMANGGAHSWNIVKIGDYYYNLDATWDAPYAAAGRPYNWFLLNMANFKDHTRDTETGYDSAAFNAQYPMAESDYVPHLDVAVGDCGDALLWALNDEGVLTIHGKGDMWDFESGSDVPWYDYIHFIKTVKLSNEITRIGDYAFEGCDHLKFIVLPDNLKSIGESAFEKVVGYRRIVIPDGVISIGDNAFKGDSDLRRVVIPASVTSIGKNAFADEDSSFAIFGHAGSAAEAYANQNGNEFHVINSKISYGTASVDGKRDEAYKNSLGLFGLGNAENAYGTTWWETAEADVFFLYDDNYLYIYATVLDDDVLTKGEAFATGDNPYMNDNIEFRLSFDGTKETFKVGVDAYGYACYGLAKDYAKLNYSDIDYEVIKDDESYAVEVAIPCDAGDFDLIEAGKLGFTYQLNDINAAGSHVNHTTSFEGEANKIPVFFELGAPATVASGTCGDNVSWSIGLDGVMTLSGEGPIEDHASATDVKWNNYRDKFSIVIIEGGISRIGDYAFAGCSNLKAIVIPDSVTSIGSNAFKDCGFNKISLPKTLTVIEDSAFINCKSLEKITIPEYVKTVSDYAFYGCEMLGTIEISEGVKNIGAYAFQGSKALTAVEIPDTVGYMGAHAFYNCPELRSITVYSTDTVFGEDCFHYCASDCVMTGFAGSTAEAYAKSHTNCLTFKAFPSTVASGACGNDAAWKLTSDGTLTVFGYGGMFDYDDSSEQPWDAYREQIASVIIADGIESIGAHAFYELPSLKTVTIPASVSNINYTAFQWCVSLESITVSEDNEHYDTDEYGVLYTEGYKVVYQYPAGNPATSFVLPEGVQNIYPNAFTMSQHLESVTLPSSLRTINMYAFAYCKELTDITVPSGITSIGDGAFRGCEKLTEIKVEAASKHFSSDADGVLYNYDKTRLIQYPAGKELTSYKTAPTTETIGHFAFERAASLENVVITHGVTLIESYAFYSCISLANVIIPRTAATIENNVFAYTSNDLVISGFAGTAAEKYAEDNDHEFKAYKNTIVKGTPTLDGVLDAEYSSPGLYNLGSGANAYDTAWDATAEADIYLLYDEHYLYICAVVDDDDVLTKGEAFATGANPYQNDCVEFRLSANGDEDIFKVTVDAYGYACFGLENHYEIVDYSAIKYATTYSDTRYTVEVAIPRSGEKYNIFTNGEIGFTYQINDIDADGNHQEHTTSFVGEALKAPVFYGLENYAEPKAGDASGDGVVNSTDAAMLVRYLSGWDGYGNGELIVSALDVNGDGRLNNVDAAIVLRHVAGWEGYKTFPLGS